MIIRALPESHSLSRNVLRQSRKGTQANSREAYTRGLEELLFESK
jgi:hypothetical protein